MNPPSSSARLPTFRDHSDIQKNISRLLNKKNYVPNLSLSRNVAKVKVEENASNESKKEDPIIPKEKRKPKRFEKTIVVADSTFAPTNDSTRNRLILSKSKIRVGGISSNIKREIVDRPASSDIAAKPFASKFEHLPSVLPNDVPVSIPHMRSLSLEDNKNNISLLTDILKPGNDGPSLILLKTPKYLPIVPHKSEDSMNDSKDEMEKTEHKCTIQDLPEGQIGKLQIMKSGRIRLVLGKCKFWLHQGIRVNFKEELAAVKTDSESKTGEIINLGDIRGRVIVVPDNVTKFDVDL